MTLEEIKAAWAALYDDKTLPSNRWRESVCFWSRMHFNKLVEATG